MRVSEVNRALSLPRLSYGVTAKALGFCWGPGALIAVFVGTSSSWWWALIPMGISASAHAILRWKFKKEPLWVDIYGRYSIMASEYHPNCRENLPEPFQRPYKVGRGLRL